RRISTRPHRSGAESPIAPNNVFSGGVWDGPGVSPSAGSRANRSGFANQPGSYSKDALSRLLRTRDHRRPTRTGAPRRSIETRISRFISRLLSACRHLVHGFALA